MSLRLKLRRVSRPCPPIGVLGIVFVAMALKATTITAQPGMLLSIFIPLLILYGLNFAVSTLVGKTLFGRNDGIALVYGTVMRNLSIALAIAINAFGEAGANAALVIALAYIIQVQSAAWYVKFTDKVFGELPKTGCPQSTGSIIRIHRRHLRIPPLIYRGDMRYFPKLEQPVNGRIEKIAGEKQQERGAESD